MSSLNIGDLVYLPLKHFAGKEPTLAGVYGIIMEVRSSPSIDGEQSYVRFPVDGSSGWFLSRKLIKVEK